MTGFGRGVASEGDTLVTVELRSVNNRFLDVQVKTPREYAALESVVQRQIKGACQRGRVDAQVRRTAPNAAGTVREDGPLFHAYVEAMRRLTSDMDEGAMAAIALRQPGVLVLGQQSVDAEGEQPIVEAALAEALARLDAMRQAEGAELAADLSGHLQALEGHVAAVEAVTADLATRLRERITARVNDAVGAAVDAARIAQEAALLAEKADVAEELARLRSHVVQARAALDSTEPVGRRLDFLVQEMHREVNTLGSKAVDHPVSARVVEMKTVLERLREQAANVE